MGAFLELATNASNRVSIVSGFIADNPPEKEDLLRDAFRSVRDLQFQLSQSGQSDEVARFLSKPGPLILQIENEWPSFLATQIANLQMASLLQKSIEEIGDALAAWKPQHCEPGTFIAALRGLEFMTMFDPNAQIDAWMGLAAEECCKRVHSLQVAVSGLVVIAASEPITSDREAFTGITFGASRMVSGCQRITVS